ncbi:MAG: 2,3-bisphosphoglycerate-independent phosphoglycerate mutase, partial [Candidatus Altiarchaeales archaeon]
METRKILLIICDGMGDRLSKGKTPLEEAEKMNMDFIAKNGICGIMDPVRQGIRPGSDTAHLSLLGYDPFKVYTGRGALEALGLGIEIAENEIALRCNFATIKNGKIIDRRAGREEYGLEEIAAQLSGMKIDGVEIELHKASGHRGVLILRGEGLSAKISDSDPEKENVPIQEVKALMPSKEAKKTAGVLNKFTRLALEILKDHKINKDRVKMGKLPANAILCRGAGTKPEIPSLEEKYGLKGICISATTLIKGVCRAAGMDTPPVEGATGHIDSNIKEKAKLALKVFDRYDLILLHIKGTDEASHDGNFDAKVKMIERIDKEVVEILLNKINLDETTMVLTSDHSTPISIRQHSADPVPIAIIGDVRVDQVKKFTERECA